MDWITQEIRNLDKSPRALRRFGFIIASVLAVIGLLSRAHYEHGMVPLFTVATFFALTGWLAPWFLAPFHVIWMTFAIILGWIMTRVILTALFLVVFIPLGILQRLFGKSLIELAIQKGRASYWQAKPEQPVRSDYERQF
jgi:hypothetical protein